MAYDANRPTGTRAAPPRIRRALNKLRQKQNAIQAKRRGQIAQRVNQKAARYEMPASTLSHEQISLARAIVAAAEPSAELARKDSARRAATGKTIRAAKKLKGIQREAQRMAALQVAVREILDDPKADHSTGGICALLVVKKKNQGWRPGPGTRDGSLEPRVRTVVGLIKASQRA